jgi:hypothetical protein
MLAGIPHEPAGITATLAFRYNPEFPLCFFNAGSLPPIAAAAVFFLHSFQSQRTGRAQQGLCRDQKTGEKTGERQDDHL